MGWYDYLLENALGLPCDHRHDSPVTANDQTASPPLATLSPGTPVFCHFTFGVAEHSGICLGDKIAHLDGSGAVACSTPAEFLARLDGANLANTIYYAATASAQPLGAPEVAVRAILRLGSHPGYHLLAANCHGFCADCLSGIYNKDIYWSIHDLERVISRAFRTQDWRWLPWNIA